MSGTVQANFRVPAGDQQLLSRVAKRLRENPDFVYRLGRFMEEEEDAGVGGLLSQRLDRVEERIAQILEIVSWQNSPFTEPLVPASTSTSEGLTVGEGRGRRLTEAGEQEFQRLSDLGWNTAAIAKAVGISPYAVRRRRPR